MRALYTLLLLPSLAFAAPSYPWSDDWSDMPAQTRALDTRFSVPAGYTRVTLKPRSFGNWLRSLPLRTDRTHVLAYDGSRLHRPSAAIVALDVGNRDLQECADALIRLHAEYLWWAGKAHKASYHFTSGDRSKWSDWRRGERFKIRGAKVERLRGKARGNSHGEYRRWLMYLFHYAGTRSLRLDSTWVKDKPFKAGDFFVQPGSPGHAVMILDIAENAVGKRVALMGQSFMPAEDVHVLRSKVAVDDLWFPLPTRAQPWIDTPSWPAFNFNEAHRFRVQ